MTPIDQPIRFKHVWDGQQVSQTLIFYFDENGAQWTFMLGTGHRFEAIYDDFIAAGGKVEDADIPT